MEHSYQPALPRPADLAEEAVALVDRWLSSEGQARRRASGRRRASRGAALLAAVLKDPAGLGFVTGFVDRVVRPEDPHAAAKHLAALSADLPRFLPWYMTVALRVGGAVGPRLPRVVVPLARRTLRHLVGHLIVDARPRRLGRAIARLRSSGRRLNLNLLGEAVLGDKEADRRLAGTMALLRRPDVDYVSIKVSAVVSQLNLWAFDETVQRISERLLPLYRFAAGSAEPKFINLDMEEYHDLDLTVAVFKNILSSPDLQGLEAGIVLQAYLPDALAALMDLTAFADRRHDSGGAGIKIRLVKGANLAMERVDAALHGWAQAPFGSKTETDTNYKRLLDWALAPGHTRSVRYGVAGHNLFDIALARLLAERRGVADRVEFEMLLGMAEEQAAAVTADVGGLLFYTPVVAPRHFDVAISYLVRRLEENTSTENFLSAALELTSEPDLLKRETERFRSSLAALDTSVPEPRRKQRADRTPSLAAGEFSNCPDSDPSLPNIRAWGRSVLSRVADSRLGNDTLKDVAVSDTAEVDGLVSSGLAAQPDWCGRGVPARAGLLRKAAAELSAARGELIEVAASETGKTIGEGDVEVSEAVDFANYYAFCAEQLATVDGAAFVPARLTVVAPPWNFPLSITAGSVLAPLAAGSSVILKPAPQARRCAAVVAEALWRAGVPRDVLILADVEEGPVGAHLISHPGVERVILTGAYETAAMFRSWRPGLPLLAETSGKNAMIVAPSADLDAAVADVVKSAFGHAGQKCSAASLVILVGPVATSRRFRNQLVDAVSTLQVGYPSDPQTQMGPLIEPAGGKLRDGLTQLGGNESWLLRPRSLDESGRLYSPGIRDGVRKGSAFHQTEYFGPVLGIMGAGSLEEAIDLQNGTPYGLTAGLHTLDPADLSLWLQRVQAGNLYVNRGITGAVVRRQPFGGWKRSSVGAGAKAGGPNYLLHLGSWEPAPLPPRHGAEPVLAPSVERLLRGAEAVLDEANLRRLRLAAAEDQRQWSAEFGVARDVSGIAVERNILRYLPVPVELRCTGSAAAGDMLRLVLAGIRAGAPLAVSADPTSGASVRGAMTDALSPESGTGPHEPSLRLLWETPAQWTRRHRTVCRAGAGEAVRVRLIGDDGEAAAALAEATGGSPDVTLYTGPVTDAGRIEMLPFLREQAVSITAHRFGNPDNISSAVF